MKNIKLVKSKGRGWFVELDDGIIRDKFAFTSQELLILRKLITDGLDVIHADMLKITNNK